MADARVLHRKSRANSLNALTKIALGMTKTRQRNFIGTYNADGSLIQEIVYLGDIPVVVITPSGNLYVHSDQLNTPREITNAAGSIVWKWENTDPFGANAANDDPDGDGNKFVFNPRFAGQYFDQETGFHYNLNRDYSPQLGRYIESDPIGLVAGINTYSYVSSDPNSFVDPLGLIPLPLPWITPSLNPFTGPRYQPGIPNFELGDPGLNGEPAMSAGLRGQKPSWWPDDAPWEEPNWERDTKCEVGQLPPEKPKIPDPRRACELQLAKELKICSANGGSRHCYVFAYIKFGLCRLARSGGDEGDLD